MYVIHLSRSSSEQQKKKRTNERILNSAAAILSVRTRSIRRFYEVVARMLPGFLRVCLPVVFFLLLSASYAAMSFGRAKSDFENPSAAGYAIWWVGVSWASVYLFREGGRKEGGRSVLV